MTGGVQPAAAMPPEEEGMLVRGARLGCCMLADGALPEGRISVVGPAARRHNVAKTPRLDDGYPHNKYNLEVIDHLVSLL